MTISEPVLPDWMKKIVEEEEEDEEDRVPLASMHLRKVKQEKAKGVRSPAKKQQSPAKKKQKKSSSEEEEFRSSDLDPISDPSDADESAKVAREVNSEEEEEESEGEGSSNEGTGTQTESPLSKELNAEPTPTREPNPHQPSPQKQPINDQTVPETPQPTIQETHLPQPSPTKPKSPEKDQPPIINEPEPKLHPTEEPSQPPAQEEAPAELQPQPAQDSNVVASEATTHEPEVVKRPKLRVKHVPTESPFKRKKRGASVGEEEGPAESVETGGEVQQAIQTEVKRQKLDVRKKQKAGRSASIAVSTGDLAGSADAVASSVPEVEKAPSDPAATKEVSDAQLLKQKTWEEAKKRLAENIASYAKNEQPVTTISEEPAAASEGAEAAKGEEAEKKKEKKKKKKGEQSSQLPPRQSGRLRSGALQK